MDDLNSFITKWKEIMLTYKNLSGIFCLYFFGILLIPSTSVANNKATKTQKAIVASHAKMVNSSINSAYQEHHPVISLDGKTMFFSRAQHPQNIGGKESHEDIWFANWNPSRKSWDKAHPFHHFNTGGSNIINSLALDGDTHMVIFGRDHASEDDRLSYSRFENRKWTEPKMFTIQNFEHKSIHDDYFVSTDAKFLFISSILDEGQDDRDLYVSTRIDESTWSTPIPLYGVNTDGNEVAPFFLDNKYLFFSSDGLDGFGDQDIYVIKRLNEDSWDEWSEPVNLGSKVNSPQEDSYFHYSKVRNSAYLIRGKRNTDILEINLHLESEVLSNFEGEPICDARYFYQNEITAESDVAEAKKCYEFRVLELDEEEVIGKEFLWDFGDNTADIGLTAKHCYEETGEYHVDFYAKDNSHPIEFNDQYSFDLKVFEDVRIGMSAEVDPDNPKSRIYSASFDNLPDEVEDVSFYWSFGDGNYDCAQTVRHDFLLEQSYQVQVTAEFDFDGEPVQVRKSMNDNISNNS